ncbi:MAG: hypothetical protein K2J00_04110 [Bacteroidaceae bacterium]|nr:hypothetical protein [Bacteroidaceae bacterium]
MNKLQLYRLLVAQQQIKNARHPMFDKNRFMKILMWFMMLYYAAILVFLGSFLPLALRGVYPGVAAFHVLDGFLVWLLIVDFYARLSLQETPVQQIRPYRLLPLRRSFLMNIYLLRSGFSIGNVFWWFMLVPFGAIGVLPLLGWGSFFLWLMGWLLVCVANGFWYLFCRALCMKNLLWILLPLAVHGGLVALMLLPDKNPLDMPCTRLMYGYANGNILYIMCTLGIIFLLYHANYTLQMSMAYNEVAKKEDVELKSATQMNYLNRWGALGEYLKMEVKLRMRNSQVRMTFLIGISFILFFSIVQYFSDVYSGAFMTSFICLYDYIVLGLMTLVSIMCFEGNYMDGLMARRESIYALLRAKYYFNTSILVFPLLIVLPLIVTGKASLWMHLGYMSMTAGLLYPMIFQMAVYNNSTLPLNQKITGKQGNTMQQIIGMSALFLPIGIEKILVLLLGNVWGYVMLMAIGAAGMATHRIWLRNIYNRFMARRYVNMDGFRASRNT